MKEEFVTFEIAEKLKEKGFPQRPDYFNYSSYYDWDGLRKIHSLSNASVWFDPYISKENIYFAPTISQVLKWLREEKNIDVEIHAEAGMLGNKVYVPFISTYTEFTLETSPDVVRYRQKKFNPAKPLSHEIIPALIYFNKWEEAALDAIEYVINNLI